MARSSHIKYVVAVLVIIFVLNCLLYVEGYFRLRNQTLSERIVNYEGDRFRVLMREQKIAIGGFTLLSPLELEANMHIMAMKHLEYMQGERNPDLFKPAQHFFKVHAQIRQTPLFQWLQRMPKGGVLHAHDTALCSTKYLVELTYREHLWVCLRAPNGTIAGFRFSRSEPTLQANECHWKLLKALRERNGAKAVDQELEQCLSLYPREEYASAFDVWDKFRALFVLVDGLLTFKPVWKDYYYHALEEFHADNVQYLELRSTLPILYDLDGSNFTITDTARALSETSDKFRELHTDFIGSKVIYAPRRKVSDEVFDKYLDNALMLKGQFPDFFAGFDLVGHEEDGRSLREFAHKLLSVQDKIDFYFHAGETNWYGTAADENVIDAVLLGTKRIGHGYAVAKHPYILRLIGERNIAVEISPISNQVLQHVRDLRNHPAAYLFARNYPMVISSDDPSFWKATPLTHDFYVAFLGIASKWADLSMLKQLAKNSIVYSALDEDQKTEALRLWYKKWDAWILQVIASNN